MRAFGCLSLALAWIAAAGSGLAAAEPTLHYEVPAGWRTEQPKSSMRLARFTLPRAAGDAEDGVAIIFFFGQGQGGTVDANLERWASQMVQAGGRPGTVKDNPGRPVFRQAHGPGTDGREVGRQLPGVPEVDELQVAQGLQLRRTTDRGRWRLPAR